MKNLLSMLIISLVSLGSIPSSYGLGHQFIPKKKRPQISTTFRHIFNMEKSTFIESMINIDLQKLDIKNSISSVNYSIGLKFNFSL
jgi:hypothetical protein